MFTSDEWSAYVGTVSILFIGAALDEKQAKFSAQQLERWNQLKFLLDSLVDVMLESEEFMAGMAENIERAQVPACYKYSPRPKPSYFHYFDSAEELHRVAVAHQTQFFVPFISQKQHEILSNK